MKRFYAWFRRLLASTYVEPPHIHVPCDTEAVIILRSQHLSNFSWRCRCGEMVDDITRETVESLPSYARDVPLRAVK